MIDLTRKSVFQSGEKITVTSGSLKGMSAIFDAESSEQRAFIFVDLLSRKNKILVKIDDLEKM